MTPEIEDLEDIDPVLEKEIETEAFWIWCSEGKPDGEAIRDSQYGEILVKDIHWLMGRDRVLKRRTTNSNIQDSDLMNFYIPLTRYGKQRKRPILFWDGL